MYCVLFLIEYCSWRDELILLPLPHPPTYPGPTSSSCTHRMETGNVEKLKLMRGGVKPNKIGIVTPYEGQRASEGTH